ncbi:hypothetical protein [Litchfieldia alkalitelluris]|uniref:hypothetical protein n=1 Tax=Litchfieldia alkalitelluris TaxID=304268 RepID=UPI001F450579|nr:hypothetical protein [Litchfieldia alkalitelluris]
MNTYYQMDPQDQRNHMKNLCKSYMNYHVIGQLSDGSQFEGIIDSMDEDSVTMLVPEEVEEQQMTRYGYNGYDDDDYYPPRRRRYRRYRRSRYPYANLLGLLLYPYFAPAYPPYSPYPYY